MNYCSETHYFPCLVLISLLFPLPSVLFSDSFLIWKNWQTTPKRQQHFSMLQQNIKEECEPEKGQDQLYESLPRKEQPEICSATIASTTEAHSNKSQCIDDTNNQNHVSSSVCHLMLADGTINRTKDSNISAPVEINSPTGTENAAVPGQCKKRFSPLHTFRRRVKKKTNLDEPAEEICSPDNDKQYSTLTCSSPQTSVNATPLLKHTAPSPLDIEDKACECLPSFFPAQMHLNDIILLNFPWYLCFCLEAFDIVMRWRLFRNFCCLCLK